MLHVVDVAEECVAEVGGKAWKHGLRYGWLVNGRGSAHQQLYQLRQFAWHFVDAIEIAFGVADVAEIVRVVVGGSASCLLVLAEGDCLANDARHSVALLAVAGTIYRSVGSLLLLAEGREDSLYPVSIVIAEVAQVTRQREDEAVA